MPVSLSQEMIDRLESQQNIWFTSIRPDGRPHMVPVWFVWFKGKFYISTDSKSVKRQNVDHHPRVVVALEDGTHPIICEGIASSIAPPYAEPLLAAFFKKYEWDVTKDVQYNHVIEVTPEKWLSW